MNWSMSSSVVFYTAITGHYDDPPPLPTRKYPCFLFSENPIVQERAGRLGWITLPLMQGLHNSPRRTARWHKMHGLKLFPEAKRTIWMDANILATTDLACLADMQLNGPVACFPHPLVTCVKDEARGVQRVGFDRSTLPYTQYRRYLQEGFPDTGPHYETGLFITQRSMLSEQMHAAWWQELLAGSFRDQISLPYIVWKLGIQVHLLGPGYIRLRSPNPYVTAKLHANRSDAFEPAAAFCPRIKRFAVARILGSELPPRDLPGSRLAELDRVLSLPVPDDAVDFYVVNAVHDDELRKAYIERLVAANRLFCELPFHRRSFADAACRSDRLQWAVNLNGARNLAVDYGRHLANYTLALDGDVVLTEAQWRSLRQTAAANPDVQHLALPQVRVDENGQVVEGRLESMIGFRYTSKVRFDPKIPYGAGNKIELMRRLGYVPHATGFTLKDTRQCVESKEGCTHICVQDNPADADLATRVQMRNAAVEQLLDRLAVRPRSAPSKAAVVIVTFRWHDITKAIVKLALDEGLIVFVVANSPDYTPIGSEIVLQQATNIGWVNGANAGMNEAFRRPDVAETIVMQNDLYLSAGFFRGMLGVLYDVDRTNLGICSPVGNARSLGSLCFERDIRTFQPVERSFDVKACNSGAFLITRELYDKIGGFSIRFAGCGWGADLDLQVRARQAQFRTVLTQRAAVRHLLSATLHWLGARGNDFHNAQISKAAGARDVFRLLYGPDWQNVVGYHYDLHP